MVNPISIEFQREELDGRIEDWVEDWKLKLVSTGQEHCEKQKGGDGERGELE